MDDYCEAWNPEALREMREEAKEAGIRSGYRYLESRKRNSTSAKDFSMTLRTDFTRRFWRYDDVFSIESSEDIYSIFDQHIREEEGNEMGNLSLMILDILKDSWYYGFYIGTLRWSKEQHNMAYVPRMYVRYEFDG